MAAGVVMLVLGLFIVFRTVLSDGSGKNLAAHILAL